MPAIQSLVIEAVGWEGGGEGFFYSSEKLFIPHKTLIKPYSLSTI